MCFLFTVAKYRFICGKGMHLSRLYWGESERAPH